MTAAQKLNWIRVTVYSVGDTITAEQALALIGSFFSEDPIDRINPAQFAPLAVELTAKPRRRRRLMARR